MPEQHQPQTRNAGKTPRTPARRNLVCTRLLFVTMSASIAFAVCIHFYVPGIIDPVVFVPPPMASLTGDYEINSRLTLGEKIFEGVVEGPESFAYAKGRDRLFFN